MKFRAIKINPLGEHDEKYGTKYWGTVHDSDMAVSFNLMNPVDIPDGAEIEFEERTIKETGPNSKKPGTEYLFLKKVRVLGGSPLKTPQNDSTKLLELIYEDTQKILKLVDKSGYEKAKEVADTLPRPEKDEVAEYDIGDGEIDMSSIPF